ncbi:M61 family metallopeptidase [Thalassomonas sp. M1454]|uniref:M61 family metallopeptidase n=1 Tax=Thalassomonas sp. M1454 TaxID=2594477 RepID=UPI00117E0A7F|nr:PDZ domain-containing protein [Thalassomonas sp. M1454]TRX58021.1 M61 family metallopeptidase [Thalassomonas sp. M1454]
MSVIAYSIATSNVNAHQFKVTIDIPEHSSEKLNLSLPAWLPGSYMIRDFAKNIISLKATTIAGDAIVQNKTDKQTWQLTTQGQAIQVEYMVYAFDLSVRTAYLDNQRGFFNGSSTFLQVKELADLACTLDIIAPENLPDWKVATGLPRDKNTEIYQFGRYCADNYMHLIDCPVELGNFDVVEFNVAGIPHYLVFAGRHFGDLQRLQQDVAKLCQHHIDLFGEAPFTEYWFITNLLADGFGGLEHKNSTVLVASRFDLPNPNKPKELTDNYQTFLSLCSHEYFHAWNVCRIKPEEFVPYDLSKESYTKQLWAYEGITSYYDDFSLYRAGIISFADYLTILAKTMTRVYRGQGELKQAVTESSYDAWTKFYQQGPDAVNNIVSYYTKGSLIALWLDLTIRSKSQGKNSLDQLMRKIWLNHGKTGIGTKEQDFIDAANELSGADLSKQISELLHQAKRVPLTELLSEVGIEFTPSGYKTLNSFAGEKQTSYQPYIGALYTSTPQGLKVTVVEQDSPAELAGLSVNDVIIGVDNIKATEKSLSQLLQHKAEGSELTCHYFRDDALISSTLKVTNSPLLAVTLAISTESNLTKWQTIYA